MWLDRRDATPPAAWLTAPCCCAPGPGRAASAKRARSSQNRRLKSAAVVLGSESLAGHHRRWLSGSLSGNHRKETRRGCQGEEALKVTLLDHPRADPAATGLSSSSSGSPAASS